MAAFGGGTRLAAKSSSAGISVSLEEDPVHLTATAYKDIGSLVQNQVELAVQGKPTAGRRRINSIVPCHQVVATPAVPQAPGWISGTESPGGGGRGRGFNNGQRWSRGRGRGNRSYPY